MKKTSQRSLLFRQNVGRTEEEWAHFLDGYRECALTSPGFWAGKEAGMKGWREGAADIFAKHGEIAAKTKSAPGPGSSDYFVQVALETRRRTESKNMTE